LAQASDQAALQRLAATGEWRSALELRYACTTPTPTTILGGVPTVLLSCTRKIGGWPYVALVVGESNRTYLADGITPTLPVMERSIGVLSGRITSSAPALPRSAADALMAAQLAAHAFSAGDVNRYEEAMALGQRTNLAEDFEASATAYRAALAMQQKALGQNSPDTANALIYLALQLSNQGQFPAAEALFRRADALAPRSTDKVAVARLLHCRALDAMNRHKDQEAMALLERAQAAYAALLPPDLASTVMRPRPVSANPSQLQTDNTVLTDPTQHSALMGLLEVQRYRAILERDSGQEAESARTIAAAQQLARATGMAVPLVSARLDRTAGVIASRAGAADTARTSLAESAADFAVVLPQTRPLATTALLQAGEYARVGDTSRAVALCETGTALLRSLRSGAEPSLLQPCLTAFAAEADRRPADRRSLLNGMFEIAQLCQDSLTSRQIQEAAARLAENARDPRVGKAVRRREDAADTLAELYRTRDLRARGPVPGAPPVLPEPLNADNLDHRIAEAQAELADADAALQTAAPNYGQLVQEVAPTADVLGALQPGEVFVSVVLLPGGGWTFALRDGQINVAPIRGDRASIAALVRRMRAGTESIDVASQFDIDAARALYDAVLGPVASKLAGARALVVAPSGPLLSVPFAELVTGPAAAGDFAHAPWLIRSFTVAHVPAPANFVALRRAAGGSRAERPWFGFGSARPVTLSQAERSFPLATCGDSARRLADLPALPLATTELDNARKLLGGSAADEIVGDAFTAGVVLRTALKDYRIVHFASHGLLPTDLRCQTEPAIVTSAPRGAPDATGALLTAAAVVGMDLDANAVILSACNTGGPGGPAGGESLSGLARAFFYAGARSLLVTHWSVNTQVAGFLVVDTLRRLTNSPSEGLAVALAAAQRGLLEGAGQTLRPEVAQPFFWAPLALIGEGGALPVKIATGG
jgi:CHAT domain-containing protein